MPEKRRGWRVVIHLENGERYSSIVYYGEAEFLEAHNALNHIHVLEKLSFDTEDGKIYFPGTLLKRAYARLERV